MNVLIAISVVMGINLLLLAIALSWLLLGWLALNLLFDLIFDD